MSTFKNIQKMIKRSMFTFLLLQSSVLICSAKDIKGVVTDAATGKPMPGVSIEAYGNKKYAAMTDDKGTYTISVPDYVSSLFFHVEGASSQQVAVGDGSSSINVKMYSDAFYSHYKRTTTTGETKTTEGFDNGLEQSIDPYIQQRLGAEVRTIGRGGISDMGNVMLINGINSISANAQPLIVIDGVWMDMQFNRTMLHDGYFNNILANINVNDIEKVEVLRNGTAIYGAKGANGVILITTKRNKSMATKIDVNIGGKYQWQPRTASVMNADDYRTYASEMLCGIYSNINGMKFLNTDPKYYYYPQYHNETDWKKESYRNAFSQNYGISVQGGDDVANYNLSVGYSMADATLKGNDFSRFDMRLNTDIEVIRNLNVRFDASFSDVKRSLLDIGISDNVENTTVTSNNFLSLIKAPFLSPYAMDVNGNTSSYLAEADDYLDGYIDTSDRSLANPAAILENGEGDNRNSYGNRLVQFSVAPRYKFNRHLSAQETFNFTLVNSDENYYLPIAGVPSFRVPGISDYVYVHNTRSSLAARQNSIQSDTRLMWDNRYDAHYINVYGGVRYLNSSYKLNVQKGYDTGNDKTPNISASLLYKSAPGIDNKYTDITWYAVGDYNYAEKYYLTAALSAQASSRFGKDADGLKAFGAVWGIFPSVQASWVLSNEKWLANTKGIDYLRLNLGFDITGNDDIDYTASRTYFIAKIMLVDNNKGIGSKLLGNVGNSTLKWESTKRFYAGVETNLLNNRVHVGFNFYKSWTDNLLTLTQMAWTSGLKENWGNDGKLENHSFDANISVKALNTKNLHWEVGASVGHYKNKVTALSNNNKSFETNTYGATVLTQVGSPVGLFYGYKAEKVFATSREAKESGLHYLDKSNTPVYFQAGDVKFADMDGNKVIDEDDRVVIGDPNPDFYGNIFSHLNWKRWTLDIAFTYSVGNDIFNYERSILESGKYFYNQTTAMNTRWTMEGQQTTMPRISYQDPHGNARFSDRWIEDGSYLRLSNVTLSYQWPINKAFLQGLTIWASANNLFTVTRYLGSNPDCALSNNVLLLGIDRGLLGVGRNVAMGVKINL